ncbi:MAG TPA: glycosyltransferase [Chloroflexota bacterium]
MRRDLHVKLLAGVSEPPYLMYDGAWIKLQAADGAGPYLLSGPTHIADKAPHCFWCWDDGDGVDAEGEACGWAWHHGPRRGLCKNGQRIILLPEVDTFTIRYVDNTPPAWAEYRSTIAVPWEQKRGEVYFVGAYTGHPSPTNPRLNAARQLLGSGLPAHAGFIGNTGQPVSEYMAEQLPWVGPEPVWALAAYKFVLSLWGNHAFNPRLYRGLEAGCLVFHQATPQVRFLDDGLLCPGRDYVVLRPDLTDLIPKLQYYLDHPLEANEIAENGHQTWLANYHVDAPYTISDILWDRFTSQPGWAEFRAAFDVHV